MLSLCDAVGMMSPKPRMNGVIDILNAIDIIRLDREGMTGQTRMGIEVMSKIGTLRGLIVALLLAVATSAHAVAEVVTVTIDGAPQNVLFIAPPRPPLAAVVMFPGGDGRIGVFSNGTISRDGNFLIRTRALWLARGFLFVAVDAAVGRAGTKGDRVGPSSQRAIAEIVRLTRQRTPAPIWLLGTSAGAPAALAGAASLPKGAIKGVAISSPVSVPGEHDSVFDVPLDRVTVSVLIQINREDTCRSTPVSNAPRIKAALKASPVVELQEFAGGDFPRTGPCEAFARHGFFGIEDQVVTAAANWILAH
jgi:pimeloyl-ACP methyl ester carboxylesterase